MTDAFIIDGIRTPIGSFGGALSSVRPDDLAAHAIAALMARNTGVDPARVNDVIFGCANQAGEDNRDVARMALLLAKLPHSVPGETVNRLCASGLSAVASAARSIKSGEGDLFIAGGVESMTRAPYVMSKAASPFARDMQLYDTSLGWRFINPVLQQMYGTDAMGETAENVAEAHAISRDSQDAFALRSQQRAAAARTAGRFAEEIGAVTIAQKKGDALVVSDDEFLRPDTTLAALSRLKPVFRAGGSVTAGNASGLNDGAAALLVASSGAVREMSLRPIARIVTSAASGVEPRVMGIGPVPASQLALSRAGLTIDQVDVIELNEAFAAQVIASLRALGVDDADPRVNINGGAIALGHPLGMSGARLALTAARELHHRNGRYALCTMCIGVGQGFAMILERV
jgi:acetyl-CoA acyltransferase